MALVFQYGSNMSSSHINERLRGNAAPLGLAITCERYDLDFTHYSRSPENQCATADLVPGSGRQIYGVLYEIPVTWIFRELKRTAKTLDEYEGEGNAYQRTIIDVISLQSNRIERAITYLVRNPKPELRTSAAYAGRILRGLEEFQAPPEYIRYVKSRVINNNPQLSSSV